MLKLIAIKNYSPTKSGNFDLRCYSSIYKILDDSSTFYFYKGYKVTEDKIISRPDDIFNGTMYSEGDPQIDFCAVVGKNGSGKSSLLELYLRVMNNLAYVCHRAINDGISYNTQFVCNIFSSVYFDDTVNGLCYVVKQNGSCIYYIINGEQQFKFDYNKPLETQKWEQDLVPDAIKAKNCLKELCYTMVINYSAYSYNPEDYLAEWSTVLNNSLDIERTEVERMEDRCWIESLFHKNDGYQLPIVLNPFRESGLVDYNNERDLTQERMYKLTMGQMPTIKTILNNSEIDRFVIDVNDDLNPVGRYYYDSYKVLSQLLILRMVNDINNGHSFKTADELGERIIQAWSKCMGVDLKSYVITEKFENGVKRDSAVLQALNYIVYKTLKITRIYSNYQIYSNREKIDSNVEDLVKELYKDGSHITLKIRRCLAFVVFRPYNVTVVSASQLQTSIKEKYDNRLSYLKDAREQHSIEKYKLNFEYDWIEDDFFPAPAFKVSMYIKKSEEKDDGMISLSTMSSGQRQTLATISTLAYHLANIESVWHRKKDENGEIAYKNVCVIFDEMDLYLHPEYQTKMIQLILDVIKGLDLKEIKSIQIICASHSPFILSDIPQSNVLYLANGNDVSEKIDLNPFCANINDILFQSFFLSDGFVGEFARKKIKSLIDIIESLDESDDDEEDKIVGLIQCIGEPIVREQLMMMYMEKRFGQNKSSKKRWLKQLMDKC